MWPQVVVGMLSITFQVLISLPKYKQTRRGTLRLAGPAVLASVFTVVETLLVVLLCICLVSV